jgi:hypothetical protein
LCVLETARDEKYEANFPRYSRLDHSMWVLCLRTPRSATFPQSTETSSESVMEATKRFQKPHYPDSEHGRLIKTSDKPSTR